MKGTKYRSLNWIVSIKEFAYHLAKLVIIEKELNSSYISNNPFDNTFNPTFNTFGTYNYYCIVHSGMKGKIIVQ